MSKGIKVTIKTTFYFIFLNLTLSKVVSQGKTLNNSAPWCIIIVVCLNFEVRLSKYIQEINSSGFFLLN